MPIVAAIIRRETLPDNSNNAGFLLIRRNSNPYLGLWALVGGKWDFGETLAQAIVREVEEETGLTTAFVALRGVVNERLASFENASSDVADRPAHYLIFVCELLATAGTPQEQAEGEVAWFSTAEVETLHQHQAIVPSDYAMLQHYSGAAALPYAEADMVVDAAGLPDLRRFEESIR